MTIQRQKLSNAARRLFDTPADAEDALQDTYLRAFHTFSDWRVPDNAWMYTVLRNIAIDCHRRRQWESAHGDAGSDLENFADLPVEMAAECADAIRHLLRRVSITDAAALLLREVYEFDYAEIAGLMGRSESATRQVLHRARVRARRPEAQADLDESELGIFRRSIESREPALLVGLLRGTTARAHCHLPSPGRATAARSATMLVQINGHYGIALVLDGIVLCVVPVGGEAMRAVEAA